MFPIKQLVAGWMTAERVGEQAARQPGRERSNSPGNYCPENIITKLVRGEMRRRRRPERTTGNGLEYEKEGEFYDLENCLIHLIAFLH